MLLKTRAIVLSALRYQETSLIVKVFTRTQGVQSVLVQSVGKPKSTFKASYFLPLNELEILAYFSQKGLSRLKEASLISVPFQSQADVLKMAISGFMVEVIQKSLHEGDSQVEVYDFMTDQVANLEETKHLATFPLQFLYELSGHLGFQPCSLEELAENQLLPNNLALDRAFLQLTQNLPDLNLSRQERLHLMALFLPFYQWHVEGFKSLQTIEVLKEVLH
jgi:DNA repair protein RecO (recombination protein O)